MLGVGTSRHLLPAKRSGRRRRRGAATAESSSARIVVSRLVFDRQFPGRRLKPGREQNRRAKGG